MDTASELRLVVPERADRPASVSRSSIWPGTTFPLGAHFDGAGVNFSVFSEVADRVELCLFDDEHRETAIALPERTAFCWHGYVPGLRPGQRYGFRVFGPWKPEEGFRCNPSKLLLDPYARAIDGEVSNEPATFGHIIAENGGATSEPNTEDSAPYVPRSVVVDSRHNWHGDTPPRTPLHRSVIYEVHVKGFTALREDLPPEIRGTYAGLSHPAVIKYLQRLGVTAVELMPIHHFLHDGFLTARGLRNYWGYNSIGFFAPHAEYASLRNAAGRIAEFRQMVRALHRAGIEVILDVVYNHTAEGNHLGPMLCFRGIDNGAYYRLEPEAPGYYANYTGTGNSMNLRHPASLQLVMDSLRYWVLDMHVDGFRFDLAATLAREFHHVDTGSGFFDVIQQDPVLSRVKLIAEPWDVGDGGYQVGKFPPRWSEWNGQYRDAVRDYWRGESPVATLATRLAGSSDLYARTRRPDASINFVTAHDGFTLRDLVSYNEKHNEANGDNNQDGESHNRSWNCGAEGPTDDRAVNRLRARQQRNMLATLLLSQGVPMLLGGDERGRTQHGNNNAYCQDNEISWFDWRSADTDLLEFTTHLIRLRRAHPTFHRHNWLAGVSNDDGIGCADVVWYTPDGTAMAEGEWSDHSRQSVMVFLNGCAITDLDLKGERLIDDSFVLMFNPTHKRVDFTLAGASPGQTWRVRLDTRKGRPRASRLRFQAGDRIRVAARTLVVLSNDAI
jgi:glycogen operon protein